MNVVAKIPEPSVGLKTTSFVLTKKLGTTQDVDESRVREMLTTPPSLTESAEVPSPFRRPREDVRGP